MSDLAPDAARAAKIVRLQMALADLRVEATTGEVLPITTEARRLVAVKLADTPGLWDAPTP